jgi:hypothetical protein
LMLVGRCWRRRFGWRRLRGVWRGGVSRTFMLRALLRPSHHGVLSRLRLPRAVGRALAWTVR